MFMFYIWSLVLLGVFADSPRPEVDFNALGHFGIGGDFDGITVIPSDIPPNTSQSAESDITKIISHHNDTLTTLGVLNLKGTIKSTCPLKVGSSNILYVGGEFSSINGLFFNNIAWIDIKEKRWSPLDSGVDGPVYSLACDNDLGMVYIGGNFSAFRGQDPFPRNKLSQEPTGIRVWNHTQSQWLKLGFEGVDGPVHSISIRSSNRNIVLGGDFKTTTDTAEASDPFANLVDLREVELTTGASLFENPKVFSESLICGTNTWELSKNTNGHLDLAFSSLLELSGLKLWNSGKIDSGLREFRVIALPSNAQISLNRVTDTGEIVPCTKCNLQNVTTPQNFIIQPKGMEGISKIRIYFDSMYGDSISLKQLELYSSTSVVSPPFFLQPKNCPGYSPPRPKVSVPADWVTKKASNEASYFSPMPEGQVIFKPTVKHSGFYNVNLYLPCLEEGCSETRQLLVNRANSYDREGKLVPQISLRESYNKRVQSIYQGFIASERDLGKGEQPISFSISIAPGAAVLPIGGLTVEKMATETDLRGVIELKPQGINLNDSEKYTTVELKRADVPFQVHAVATSGYGLAVGGKNGDRPVAQIWSDQVVDLMTETNSVGTVDGLVFSDNKLVVGGSYSFFYTRTQTLIENLSQHDLKTRVWGKIYENLTTTAFSGFHEAKQSIFVAGKLDVTSESTSPTRLSYLNYAPGGSLYSPVFVSGKISAISTTSEPDPWVFFSGHIQAQESIRSTNVGYFSPNSTFVSFPAVLPSNVTAFLQGAHINTGLFSPQVNSLQQSNLNRTSSSFLVVGGTFQAGGFSGVALFQNGSWSGLGQPIDGEVLTLHCADSDLFVGGEFDGPLESRGLVKWSFTQGLFERIPNPLTGSERPRINSLARIETESNVIVAGRFSGPKGVPGCRNICLLEADLLTWEGLKGPLPDEVEEIFEAVYFENSIMAAPKISQKSSKTHTNDILIYNFGSKQWNPAGLQLAGQPHHIKFDNKTRGLFIFGSSDKGSFLSWWDGNGKNFTLGQPLQLSSRITHAMVIPIKPTADVRSPVAPLMLNTALLVSGELHLESYGNCSGAIFDGSRWFPYFTSTRLTPHGTSPGSAILFKDAIYYPRKKEYLPVPLIILISLAISLAIVFFIIGIGMLLTFLKHQRQQISRQALVPLLSDASPVGPSAMAFTSPLASPIAPHHNIHS